MKIKLLLLLLLVFIPIIALGFDTRKDFIDELQKEYKNLDIIEVADGIARARTRTYNSTLNIIFVGRNYNKQINVEPVLANKNRLKGLNFVQKTCEASNSLICVNGTYFSLHNGIPLGLLKKNDEIFTGDIYGRAGIGILEDGFYFIDRVYTQVAINDLKINSINQPRMLSTHSIVYNSKWGNYSPSTPKYGKQIVVNNGIIAKMSYNACQIPVNGYVIVGPEKYLRKLKIGQTARLKVATNHEQFDNAVHIISGGPMLVKNGIKFVDTEEEKLTAINGKFPRTAIGYTNDGTLIITTIDKGGVTLNQLSDIMLGLKCDRAMNLDGGTSTGLYVKGLGLVANGSTDKTRPVSNSVVISIK